MRARFVALWMVFLLAGVAVFLWVGDAYPGATAWMTRAGTFLVLLGAAGSLYALRGTGDRKGQVTAIALAAFGASQYIPSMVIRLTLMPLILIAMLAAIAGVPASFFRHRSPSAK